MLSDLKKNTETKQEIRVHIRWMIRHDMPQVVDIEEESFEFPWNKEDFVCNLRRRDCIGMVAEYKNYIVGFMIYELHRTTIRILNFAVHPAWRCRGVGSQMLAKLTAKLSLRRRKQIILEVRETNLSAQLFFRANEFRAISVLRGYYTDTPEDAYRMQLRYHLEKIITPDQMQTDFRFAN